MVRIQRVHGDELCRPHPALLGDVCCLCRRSPGRLLRPSLGQASGEMVTEVIRWVFFPAFIAYHLFGFIFADKQMELVRKQLEGSPD